MEVCIPREGRLPLGMQPFPPVDRMTDKRLRKHYLPATSFADGNKTKTTLRSHGNLVTLNHSNEQRKFRCWIPFRSVCNVSLTRASTYLTDTTVTSTIRRDVTVNGTLLKQPFGTLHFE